ncbi:MAG: hypothetical protein ACLPQS_15660 [Acidimicrobiales bacterium]
MLRELNGDTALSQLTEDELTGNIDNEHVGAEDHHDRAPVTSVGC